MLLAVGFVSGFVVAWIVLALLVSPLVTAAREVSGSSRELAGE